MQYEKGITSVTRTSLCSAADHKHHLFFFFFFFQCGSRWYCVCNKIPGAAPPMREESVSVSEFVCTVYVCVSFAEVEERV